MQYFEKHIRDGNTLEVFKTQIVYFTEEGFETFVPKDEGNKDYSDYLAWVAEGNTPEVMYNDSEYRARAYPEEFTV